MQPRCLPSLQRGRRRRRHGIIRSALGQRDPLTLRAVKVGGVIFIEENGEGPGVRLRKAIGF
jgi:hypothetical protein